MKIYRAGDVPRGALDGESIAVLGYGNLGRSAALNLRDSGVNVRIGNRDDPYAEQARADGFEVVSLAAAARDDIVFVLLPDEVIPEVLSRDVAAELRPRSAVAFASGYCLAFGLVHPPETVDVLLVAPRMAGIATRTRYMAGRGFWACVGVEADRSGRALRRMLGLADALGALRPAAIEMTAATEATLDLFVEQTLGPLLGTALMTAFDVGCEGGIPAEALVMEMYMSSEMEAVFEGFRTAGFLRSSEDHGPTAIFGGLTRAIEIDRVDMAARFHRILEDIKSGAFAERFQSDARDGSSMLSVAQSILRGRLPITDAEARLRRAAHLPDPPADRG
ncbi:MAG TPA: NAD(P)-binding domain-containing protein [Gemmatimonadales bacterium]|nr:NAD(P)-binding domain-containing protein [Gemmatimonadales bacterium]